MIYALTGQNGFMLQERKQQVVNDFVQNYGDLALEQLDCEEVEANRIRESLESLPFLASKKLVVLLKPSINRDFAEIFKTVFENIPETTDVLIVEPKPDKRSAFYKFIKKLDGFQEFSELDAAGLIKWAQGYVGKWDASIDVQAARELVNRAGTDQMRLKNELDKLSMYRSQIDVAAVKELTVATPSSTIFELLDAAFHGRKKQAMQLYVEQRTLNVDPIQIIAMLAWQFHVLAVVKSAGNKPAKIIASEAKLNPFVVQKTQSIASTLTFSQIQQLVHELRELDEKLKSTKINADDALQAFFLTMADLSK